MEYTECTCEETTERCQALLDKSPNLVRKHFVTDAGTFCSVMHPLEDGSFKVVSFSLIKVSAEAAAAKELAATEAAAIAAIVAEKEAELERLRQKRLAGEELTLEESNFVMDHLLGL